MDRTFNNGIGYVLVVAAAQAERVLAHLRRRRTGACRIGAIVRGPRGLTFADRDA
jgi:phosphoribosylaminoimidazole (AIR) synthetase